MVAVVVHPHDRGRHDSSCPPTGHGSFELFVPTRVPRSRARSIASRLIGPRGHAPRGRDGGSPDDAWLGIHSEEKLLREAFGARYEDYARRVKGFIPFAI